MRAPRLLDRPSPESPDRENSWRYIFSVHETSSCGETVLWALDGLTNGGTTELTWQEGRLSIIDSQHLLSGFLPTMEPIYSDALPPSIMSDLSQLLAFRDRQQAANVPLLLVTIVRTAGSTYRKPGARLLLTSDGQHEGTISGGCLEADLLETSWNRLESNGNRPTMMRYDTSEEGEMLWGTRTGCGGT